MPWAKRDLGMIRRLIVQRRQRLLKHRRCDICDSEPGTEWHHIYSRWLTQQNEAARYFSNQPEVGAWLCHNCHVYETNSPEKIDFMFQKLYQIWSFEAVEYYHNKITSYLHGGQPFRIPEPEGTPMLKEPKTKYYGWVVYDFSGTYIYAAAGYSEPVLNSRETACIHQYPTVIDAFRAIVRYERMKLSE